MCDTVFLIHPDRKPYKIQSKVKTNNNVWYEVGECIGSGGNSVVHIGTDTISGNQIAIKFLLSLSRKGRERFIRESRLLSQIDDNHVIKILDQGKITATKDKEETSVILPFIIMPLADKNLKDLVVTHNGSIPYEEYISQFRGLCKALKALHQHAIHRDIKPENILVMRNAWVLADFGLCRFDNCEDDITADNKNIGPRYWMSPEAMNKAIGNADIINKASDVYQLCSVFWYVVTKRHPTGCLDSSDWPGYTDLYHLIVKALSHDHRRRPVDGSLLSEEFDEIFYKRPKE